jgi:dihydroxyacetone kinase-like protein
VTEAVTCQTVVAWLRAYADAIAQNREYLTELDSAIGDADHGSNMDRGMKAVASKLDELPPGGIGALLTAVGMTLVSTVGGAGGPLYGTLFLQMGAAAGPASELTTVELATALEAGVRGVQARGKAELGDKTMIDALLPACEALKAGAAAGLPPADALRLAAEAAEGGMKATIPLVARKGRASYLGERSAGHQDPGATSSWLLLESAVATLGGSVPGGDAPDAAGSGA